MKKRLHFAKQGKWYKAIHYYYYDVHIIDGLRNQVEIQVRTLAINFWGTVEHSLQYKIVRRCRALKERLHAAADAIVMLDKEMSSVRGEIMDAQNYMHQTDSVISEILNNIQNLYRVANKREIDKIQDEFYRLYGINDLEMLERFRDELDIITEGYRAQSLQED